MTEPGEDTATDPTTFTFGVNEFQESAITSDAIESTMLSPVIRSMKFIQIEGDAGLGVLRRFFELPDRSTAHLFHPQQSIVYIVAQDGTVLFDLQRDGTVAVNKMAGVLDPSDPSDTTDEN